MKKLLSIFLTASLVLSLASCASNTVSDQDHNASSRVSSSGNAGGEQNPEFVTVNTLNAQKVKTEVEVPYDAKRLAVLDLAVLDMLDNFGVADRVVGVSKGSSIEYLKGYVTDDKISNLGTIKEVDLEAVMACEPDIIFIGGRLSAQYDALSEIAPVVYIATDVEQGVVKSTSENAMNIASIFGMEDSVSSLMADYHARIAALHEAAEGKTAVVGMVNSGGFGVLGNDGRCSIIGVEIGFENIGLEAAADSGQGGGGKEASREGNGGESSSEKGATATHGNEASFEVLVALDPDYIFVMDRDAAIGTEGAQLAAEVMDNELVATTAAYQNGNVIILEHSNVWYTAEGGITALDIMLADLEQALL